MKPALLPAVKPPAKVEVAVVDVAMYAAAVGFSDTEALQLFREALATIAEGDQVESDSDALLQEILTSTVRTNSIPVTEMTVLNMINLRMHGNNEECLNNHGIFFSGDQILLNRRIIARELLRDGDWKDRRLDMLLSRLPGAERVMKRFGTSVMRFVAIPRNTITLLDMESDEKTAVESFVTDPFA